MSDAKVQVRDTVYKYVYFVDDDILQCRRGEVRGTVVEVDHGRVGVHWSPYIGPRIMEQPDGLRTTPDLTVPFVYLADDNGRFTVRHVVESQ